MKLLNGLLVLSLAVSFSVVESAQIHTCARRNFLQFVQRKLKKACLEMSELRESIAGCCNKNDCLYDGQARSDGSIFTAVDGCNACVCNNGSVDCTNATGCGQDVSTYHYKDVIAQGFCATKATLGDHTSAVRRDCEGDGNTTCNDICADGGQFSTEITTSFPSLNAGGCVGGLWIWFDHPRLAANPGPGQTDPGRLNMVTISYASSGCSATGCGPNYCCCWQARF